MLGNKRNIGRMIVSVLVELICISKDSETRLSFFFAFTPSDVSAKRDTRSGLALDGTRQHHRRLYVPPEMDDGLMAEFGIKALALPSVCLLISLLGYSSQVLFLYLEPGPLTFSELLKFNGLLLCTWICYFRACWTNPGNVPQTWTLPAPRNGEKQEEEPVADMANGRWCRKCEVLKPPRAHHCRICGRSVWWTPSLNFIAD